MLRVCFRKNGERYDTESMANRHRSWHAVWLHTPVGLVPGTNQSKVPTTRETVTALVTVEPAGD